MSHSNTESKTVLGVITAVFAYLADSFNELIVILALLIMIDYLLGITVSLTLGEFDPKKGILGIIKKIGYVCLVVLGFLLDYTIDYFSVSMKLGFRTNGVFGYAITCYLIGNEGMSNLKSLALLGLPIPFFLSRGFGIIKDKFEQAAEQSMDSVDIKLSANTQEATKQ